MASKKELEKKLEYARGYRDALVDTWESVIKLVTKGYSSRELQIMGKTQYHDAKYQMDAKIAELEADYSQDEIIDADDRENLPPMPVTRKSTPLKPGMSIMFKESRPAKCYELFQKEIASGRPGICISRISPREIRDSYIIGKTRVIWLTNSEKSSGNLPPSALGLAQDDSDDDNDMYVHPSGSGLPSAFSTVLDFIGGNPNSVVLLEGLEYISAQTKFDTVLNFFQMLNESVKKSGANLIISVNPNAFDPRQFSQLETEINQVV
jgi:hypothetical protein